MSLTLKSTGHNASEHTNTEEPTQEAASTGRTAVWGSEVRESDPTLTSHRATRFMEAGLWLPPPSPQMQALLQSGTSQNQKLSCPSSLSNELQPHSTTAQKDK